jgi:hypothetical protein
MGYIDTDVNKIDPYSRIWHMVSCCLTLQVGWYWLALNREVLM